MGTSFEVHSYDGAGRRGELRIPRSDDTVQTPALLPVVNPHVQTVPPAAMQDTFGAQAIITNSYILYGSDELRKPAKLEGLHELLGFDGPIMTDSGSFQLAEYGTIDVTTEEILAYQDAIGSDIATPVDIPTPPDVNREQAESDWSTTLERLRTATDYTESEMLITAPIQGSTYPDIREQAAREAVDIGLDIHPIGAVVPLMTSYRYADLVDVVVAAKRGLGAAPPVHLFGAGHPMVFALAAAMGCDLFDSAAYALYARDEKYLTVNGTEFLADIEEFPCQCSVCTEFDPSGLRSQSDTRRHEFLARHNLAVSFAEIRRVREAIRRGTLFELLETRASAHPEMRAGYQQLLEYVEYLESTDPVSKETFFYSSPESARRPEVWRYHQRLERIDAPAKLLLTGGTHDDTFEVSWDLKPPFGPVPPALRDVYPLTAEVPDRPGTAAYQAAARGINRLLEANPETTVTIYHDNWPESALEILTAGVETSVLGETE